MRCPTRICSLLLALSLVSFVLPGCFGHDSARPTSKYTPLPPSTPPAPSHDDRVKSILDAEGVNYKITSQGNFKMTWKRNNGRTHVIVVKSKTWSLKPLEIREIWAAAYKTHGELSRDVAFRLLQDSNQRKLGAWEAHGDHDESTAVFVAKISADASAQRLMSAITLVLQVADDIEKELMDGRDDF
jgi:hypothetical protein